MPVAIRKNFSWTLVGNLYYSASQWGVLIIFAKLGSVAMVGSFALGLAITAPIILMTNLQLRNLQATDVRDVYSFREYLMTRISTITLALILILSLDMFFYYGSKTFLVVLFVGISKSIESVSDLIYGYFQKKERFDFMATSFILRGTLSLFFVWFSVYFTKSVFLSVVSLSIAWALVLLFFDIPYLLRLTGSDRIAASDSAGPPVLSILVFFKEKYSTLLFLALPLGMSSMLVSLIPNIPRYYIDYYFGEEELGVFAAIAYLMIVGTTVVGALCQSAAPRFAKLYSCQEFKEFRMLLAKLLCLVVFLGVSGVTVVFFLGSDLLRIFYTSEYSAYSNLLIMIMVASCFGYITSIFISIMTVARYLRAQAIINLVSITIVIVSCYFAIKYYGLNGAAFAIIVGSLSRMIGSIFIGLKIAYCK